MTRPTSALILVTSAVAAPLCTIAGLIPTIAGVCYAGLAAFAVVAAIDAIRLTRVTAGWEASAPPALRWFKDREETLAISLRHVSGAAQGLRLHVTLPPEIKTRERTISARIDGAGVVEVRCTPSARGDFTLHACDIEQRSPFHLWFGSRALVITSAIRVYPDLRKERAADLIRSHHFLGTHIRRQLGKGREFEKLREYEHGDSFEDIDWKATARRQKPVVKVFQIERTQEIYAVIDSSRLSAREGILDAYVSAALALAMTAESQHDRFGLVSFSAGVDTFIPAAGGKRHFAFCRDAIYALQPRAVTPDLEEVFSYLHTHLRKRALIIFLTALDDPFLADAFMKDVRVLSRRHLVMVNVPERADVRPLFSGPLPETPDQIYTKLAGHMQWTGLRELQKTLERKGVRLAMVNPTQLPAQLARQYLDIKQRQLL
ncbi:MAG TPA: DUF58 domain-containing protein [Bryobacteraceae bacterium]|nr:DUF58 domain-containing protein [Bryobacteraceae bacterium]